MEPIDFWYVGEGEKESGGESEEENTTIPHKTPVELSARKLMWVEPSNSPCEIQIHIPSKHVSFTFFLFTLLFL